MTRPIRAGSWLVVIGMMASAASAFIFVPQRGGTAVHWSADWPDAAPTLPLVSDLDGNVYLTEPGRLRVMGADDGRELWHWEPPEGYDFDQPPVIGSELVIAVATHDGVPADRLLAALPIWAHGGQNTPRWTQRRLDMPRGGVHIPLADDPEDGDFGYAALLSGDLLSLLKLDTGETLARREVGVVSAPPLWLPRVGFVPIAGDCNVTAINFQPDPAALTTETVKLPGESFIKSMLFDSDSGQLVVQGLKRAWTARFVLVPARGGAFQGVGEVGEAPSAVAGDGAWNATLEGGQLTLRPAKSADVAWSLTPPEGWLIEPPMIVADDRVVVIMRANAGHRAELHAYAVKDGTEVWQRNAPGLPIGGVHLGPEDQRGAAPARLAVLCERSLLVLNLSNGEPLARRELGTFTGSPLWAGDSGFVPTSDGYQEETGDGTAPAVVAFDILAAGREDDPSAHWFWRLPPGETVQSLEWLPRAKTVVARGEHGMYVFN